MAGISDIRHDLCLALALWNGNDPILKERMFGLTGPQGNHGEDVKEYWWYLEGLPSHALLRWRYHYPQAAFPYDAARPPRPRARTTPSSSCSTPASFDDDRYWSVDVTYAKASPTEVLMRIELENHGPDEATLDVLPTLWFRNTWSWDDGATRPRHRGRRRGARRRRPPRSPATGSRRRPAPTARSPRRCSARTRRTRRASSASDADDAVPEGRHQRPRRLRRRDRQPGRRRHEGRAALPRDRRRPAARPSCGCGCTSRGERSRPRAGRPRAFDEVVAAREADADEFYAALAPDGTDAEHDADPAPGLRRARLEQADVPVPRAPLARRRPRRSRRRPRRTGTAATPAGGTSTRSTCSRCPTRGSTRGSRPGTSASTASRGRTSIPAFAKYQLLVLLREWFQHPNGALPAYEWNFDDVNPPVHVMAALRVFVIDGATRPRVPRAGLPEAAVNFTWWLNRQDADGNNVFGGGFLGLDNISPIDRSNLPRGRRARAGRRHGVDGVLRARRCS